MNALVSTENENNALGPAMRALNARQRAFVFALFEENPGHGALAAAARRAGYGNPDGSSTARTMATIASRLADDERVQAAITEITKKRIRREGPAAVAAINEIVSNPGHKDRLRAATTILERIDPVETKHKIEVTHKADHTKSALEHLEYLLRLGTSEEALLAEFGPIGLPRLRALLAKPIDAEFTVIEPSVEDDIAKQMENL